jgi:hypothetical protein
MAQSDRKVGKNAYFQFVSSAGTAVLTPDFTEFSWGSETKVVEQTAGADAGAYYAKTYRDITLKITMFFNSVSGTAFYAKIQDGDEGTATFGPLGTATGNQKGALACVVTKADWKVPFDDSIMVDLEFKPQGDWISDPAVSTY